MVQVRPRATQRKPLWRSGDRKSAGHDRRTGWASGNGRRHFFHRGLQRLEEYHAGVLGIPGLNTTVPFQLEDWELTGIRWDQIFALSSERNERAIFSTPSLMVSHNAAEVHILIEDERNIVIPTYYGNTSTDGGTSTGQQEQDYRQDFP